MDRAHFKQRIVGAIVLVALGIIFIPIILNQEGDDSPITGSNIPEKPETLQELAIQQPPAPPAGPEVDTDKPRLVDEATPPMPPIEQTDTSPPEKPEAQAPATKPATKPATEVKQPPKTEEKPAAEKPTTKTRAWVVQVASFAERSKALKLRDRLRKAKYSAFVESVSSSKGTRYRVRVGPVVQRIKADALKKKISKEFKIKDALVMSHP